MRRWMVIAMFILSLAMVITGIWNIFPPFDTMFFPSHVVNSVAFGILAVIHVWLNWKAIVRYFKGLGWWWLLVGLGFLGIVWSVAIMPALYIAGLW